MPGQHSTEATLLRRPAQGPTHHIHRAEHMAVVVAGLQVLGDVGKGTEVLRVLGRTGNVPDLVLRNDVLPGKAGSGILGPKATSARLPHPRHRHLCPSPGREPTAATSPVCLMGVGALSNLAKVGLGVSPSTTAMEGVRCSHLTTSSPAPLPSGAGHYQVRGVGGVLCS